MRRAAGVVAVGLALGSGVALGVVWDRPAPITDLPATVEITPVELVKEAAGSFRIGGKVAAPPVVTQPPQARFQIMTHQVSVAEYARCVAEAACLPTQTTKAPALPRTQVSFNDAQAYATWFSRRTGQNWRLPSDSEWLAAAGDQITPPDTLTKGSVDDPSVLWLRSYRQTVLFRGNADPVLRAPGGFGTNRNGVADMAGNIWEWTSTCFDRITLAPDGMAEVSRTPNCGVRVAQGKHRAYVVDFIRDARAGGCAAGIPPDHLGFRLVHDSD